MNREIDYAILFKALADDTRLKIVKMYDSYMLLLSQILGSLVISFAEVFI